MSSKSYKKSPTKDQVTSHNTKKTRNTEDENFIKKVNEKKFQKKGEKQKKTKLTGKKRKRLSKSISVKDIH